MSGISNGVQVPRQLFAPGADAIIRLVLWVLFGGTLAVAIGLCAWARGEFPGDVGVAPAQPVPFSHKHHTGELGIDCRNCHQQAETQATAGLPPTHTCMTCHSEIWTRAGLLAPVRESYARNEPLRWTRVNRLPDYVYFNHAIHADKGVGCSSCHGSVDAMQLTYPAQSFRMDFCLACHRAPDRQVRPRSEIWNMHWVAPPDQATTGPALVAAYNIRTPARLSECSICHR